MIHVAGGVYRERCTWPAFSQLLGSGGRAAAALSAVTDVELSTYVDAKTRPRLEVFARSLRRLSVRTTSVRKTISFDYLHPLATPTVLPAPHMNTKASPMQVKGRVVLRFGMLEGEGVIAGDRVVYDPQSAYEPVGFSRNGSSARSLAIVANRNEASRLTGIKDAERAGKKLLRSEGAEVVVVKLGSEGAAVISARTVTRVPAYRARRVFKIGSGDMFAAGFTYYWGLRQLAPHVAADLASRCTARYCETRSPEVVQAGKLRKLQLRRGSVRPGTVYLAGPFFSLSQRWMVEEARAHLLNMGLRVLSPAHDIGIGTASEVAPADIRALRRCDRVLALADGVDAGTLFEVGYARSIGLPVVVLAETMSREQLKMLVGTNCRHTDDFCTAIYLTAWAS
jgi:hypothetical protein